MKPNPTLTLYQSEEWHSSKSSEPALVISSIGLLLELSGLLLLATEQGGHAGHRWDVAGHSVPVGYLSAIRVVGLSIFRVGLLFLLFTLALLLILVNGVLVVFLQFRRLL